MHFYTLALTLLSSTFPSTLAAVMSAAEPATDPSLRFARQADVESAKSCRGPIVNLYDYPTTNCRNTLEGDTAAEQNSPIRDVLKFAPFNDNPLSGLSPCRNLARPANSLAFEVDGSKLD